MEDKIVLINRYKKVKINAYCTLTFWLFATVCAIIGLILAVIPGVGTDVIIGDNESKKNVLNKTGIIILSVLFALGLIVAISSQIFFPWSSKKYLRKINDSNYSILVDYINKCYTSPFAGSITLLKQIDWIIKYKQESDKQIAEIKEFLDEKTTRLQREKLEQEKIDLIYKQEANSSKQVKQEQAKTTASKKNNVSKNKNNKSKKITKKSSSSKSKSSKTKS